MKRPLIIILAVAVLTVAGFAQPAFARDGSDDVSPDGIESTTETMKKQREALIESQKKAAEEQREAAKEKLEAEREKIKEEQEVTRDAKLAETKKASCEKRVASIQKIITRTSNNAQHHYDMITKVYTNVQAFATKKEVNLSDYAALVEKVKTAQTNAQTALAEAKTSGESFSCDVAAPKSAAEGFLASKKTQSAALKAYRDAVKELLVAVKSAAAKTSTDDSTASTGEAQ